MRARSLPLSSKHFLRNVILHAKKNHFVRLPPRESVVEIEAGSRLFPWLSTEAETDAVEVTSEADVLVTLGFRNNKLTLRLKLAKRPMYSKTITNRYHRRVHL